MKPCYPDLLEGRPEPLWYDERGVPRWVEWEPGIGEEDCVYEAVLLLVMCQNCGKEFRVSMHHDWYEWRRDPSLEVDIVPDWWREAENG